MLPRAGEPTVRTPAPVRKQPSAFVSEPASARQNVAGAAPTVMLTLLAPELYGLATMNVVFVGTGSVIVTRVALAVPELVSAMAYSIVAPGMAFGFVALLNGSDTTVLVF